MCEVVLYEVSRVASAQLPTCVVCYRLVTVTLHLYSLGGSSPMGHPVAYVQTPLMSDCPSSVMRGAGTRWWIGNKD